MHTAHTDTEQVSEEVQVQHMHILIHIHFSQ